MDISYAKEIVTVLADGINPVTGEVLPETDSCNQPDVIRALHTILAELDRVQQKSSKPKPENAGMPWSTEEDEKLLSAYREGVPSSELAKIHKRTKTSIKARLVRLGEIDLRMDAK